MADTFADAVLQALRASMVRTVTGDTYAGGVGTIEIGYDVLPPDAMLPYVVVGEPGERRTYFTAGPGAFQPFLADGTINISCYDTTRDSTLAHYVRKALQDLPLAWGTSSLNTLRCTALQHVPMQDVGPEGSATIFLTTLQFTFQYQGTA